MSMSPYFSVIIPTLNEEKNLPAVLESLKKQTFREFEVIISDSNSVDGTKAVSEKYKNLIPSLVFVNHKSKNVSQARNFGATLAKGSYLIFFDADVSFEPVFFEKMREHIEVDRLDALTVWNRPKEKGFSGWLILSIMNISLSLFQKIKPAANGPCIFIKKELFENLKGFDDQIVFGEDFDLIQRAHKLHARFAVFRKPLLYVSIRRFEKEGFVTSLYKSIKALCYQFLFGPIKKPIFDYKMGGKNYDP